MVPRSRKIDELVDREKAKARSYLDQVAQRLADGGLTVHTAVRAGRPAAEIAGWAEREDVDLIALATHGRSGIQRWMHGSVADGTLHATATPLLLLQPSSEGSAVSLGSGPIVVPLDGSPAAEGALPLAEELARALAAPLVLLRIIEIIGRAFTADPYGGDYVNYQAVIDLLRADAARNLEEVADSLRKKALEVATDVSVGSPVESIVARAREHPGGLIVLSTHGRTGWRAMLLGSVTRRVVLQAGNPVVVVPPPEVVA